VSDSAIVLTVAFVYLAACLVVGMWPSKRTSDSAEGYVAGDRAMGLLVMYFITGATIFSAFAFLGMPGWAYSKGVAALYILGYGSLGFVPFYFLGPRAARVGKAMGFVTQAEMVSKRFGSRAIAGLMAVVSVYALVPYVALQMKGAGYVLEAVSGGAIAEHWGALIVYSVVATYVLKSGVLGVGWTNTFQGILMMVLAWTFGLYLPWKLYGGVGPMFDRLAESHPEMLRAPGLASPLVDAGGVIERAGTGKWASYSSTIVVSIIGFSVWPQLFMRAFSAKSEKVLRRTVVLYPTFQLFLVPILLIGFAGILFVGDAPLKSDEVLPHLIMQLDLSPVIVGLFCAGALAASMSSGDAFVHAAGSILVRDGLVTCLGKQYTPHEERRLIRIFLVVVLIVSYALAVTYQGSLASLLIYAYGPISQFFPAVTATLCWRRATGAGVLSGLVAGSLVSLAFVTFLSPSPWGVHPGLYGLLANVTALVTVSLATQRPDPTSERFLTIAGRAGP